MGAKNNDRSRDLNKEIVDVCVKDELANSNRGGGYRTISGHGERLYSKPLDGDRDYRLIIVITEDSSKTPGYFKPIEDQNLNGFKIVPITDKLKGVPASHMKQKAEECMENYGLVFEAGDELYMLCDVDHYRVPLRKLYNEKDPNWHLIVSNPCIEVWFYYHFTDIKPSFPPCKNERDYSKHMKRMCNEIKNGGINCGKLLSDIDINVPIKNAMANFAFEEGGDFIPCLGATQMPDLMTRLKPLLRV